MELYYCSSGKGGNHSPRSERGENRLDISLLQFNAGRYIEATLFAEGLSGRSKKHVEFQENENKETPSYRSEPNRWIKVSSLAFCTQIVCAIKCVVE
jgi:hypothetical protein